MNEKKKKKKERKTLNENTDADSKPTLRVMKKFVQYTSQLAESINIVTDDELLDPS